jgi:hypothetical protein
MKLHSVILLILLAICLSFVGCATPQDADMRTLGIQTFGTDANLKIYCVTYSGPMTSALSTGLGNTSEEVDLASEMQTAKTRNVDLVVWSDSSSAAASTLLRALRYPSVQGGLSQLRLLFVGDAKDADRVRPAVEATGAKFYYHPTIQTVTQ